MNWDKFSFIDLFAGIGGIRLGFIITLPHSLTTASV